MSLGSSGNYQFLKCMEIITRLKLLTQTKENILLILIILDGRNFVIRNTSRGRDKSSFSVNTNIRNRNISVGIMTGLHARR